MEEPSLLCNFRNCKERLKIDDYACVTSCFHIFCKDHVIHGIGANRKCHACDAILEGEFDVFKHVTLNPSDGVNSFLLTGYSLEVIFDIMSKAMQFWDYQINLEVMQYKTKVEKLKTNLSDKERYIESLTLNIKHHIKKQQEKISCLNNEIEKLTTSSKCLEKQVEAKNRQLSYMQSKFNDVLHQSVPSWSNQGADDRGI